VALEFLFLLLQAAFLDIFDSRKKGIKKPPWQYQGGLGGKIAKVLMLIGIVYYY